MEKEKEKSKLIPILAAGSIPMIIGIVLLFNVLGGKEEAKPVEENPPVVVQNPDDKKDGGVNAAIPGDFGGKNNTGTNGDKKDGKGDNVGSNGGTDGNTNNENRETPVTDIKEENIDGGKKIVSGKNGKNTITVYVPPELNETVKKEETGEIAPIEKDLVYKPNNYSKKVESVYKKHGLDLTSNAPNDFIAGKGDIRHAFFFEDSENNYVIFLSPDNKKTFDIGSDALVSLGVGLSKQEILEGINKSMSDMSIIHEVNGVIFNATGKAISIKW